MNPVSWTQEKRGSYHIELIAKVTNLSIKDIEKLKEELN